MFRPLGSFALDGYGWALPERVLDNATLGAELGVDPDSIEARTGILERRVSGPEDRASTLGAAAARRAITAAGVDPESIDLVILSTYTPDVLLCPTSPALAASVGARHAGAIDLNAACSGGVSALLTGVAMLEAGACRRALVVASDLTTKFVAPDDPKTRLVFGDGAAALLIASCSPQANGTRWTVLASCLGSDGSGADLFCVPGGGSAHPGLNGDHLAALRTVTMNGRAVFRFGVEQGARVIASLCERAGVAPGEVRWVVPHQANLRIIQALKERTDIPDERWVLNLSRYGNTASASVTLAWAELVDSGRIAPGDVVLLVAFGAGLTWSGLALRAG